MIKKAVQEQREKLQRGIDFQDEVRRSWRLIPGSWRFKLPDRNGDRPGDEIVLLKDINILAEMKRTEKDRFELSFLRPNQAQGLVAFDQCNPRNFGLVFVSFNTWEDDAGEMDITFAFRLIDAMQYMRKEDRQYIRMDELAIGKIPRAKLTRLQLEDGPGYDLKGVETCYRYT